MSFDKEIGAPFTLASLPQALSSNGGQVNATSVCSISGTKKRKRTEIAVGIDGEGIFIYSLQNPHLVTSYALPPQTSFVSAPYSIYHKGTSKTSSRRYTYAVVTEATPGVKPQLVCFTEETQRDTTIDIVKTSYTPSSQVTSAVGIDAIPGSAGRSQQQSSHNILVVFEGGESVCLSGNLEEVRWIVNLQTLVPSHKQGFSIEHASLSTARAVTHGLLRSREDIAATINPSMDDKSDLLDLTHVLCVVSRRSDSARTLGLYHVQPRSPDLPTSHLSPLKHLLNWDLPSSLSFSPRQFSLHANSGTLYLLTTSELVSYDFSGTIPTLSSTLSVSASDVSSFLRISPDLLFTATHTYCRLIDVKYNSVQAALSITSHLSNSTPVSKKRKHAHSEPTEESSTPPTLVAYFADLGLAVAVWNDELVGFQLGVISPRKRAKVEGTRLIDSLGKGISADSSAKKEAHDWQRWQSKKAKLDKYASKGNIAKFEQLFAEDLGIALERDQELSGEQKQPKLVNGAHDAVMTNGISDDSPSSLLLVGPNATDEDQSVPLRKWMLPRSLPSTQRSRQRQYASYALSRIFRWIPSPSSHGPHGRLKVDYFPPNVFQWILQSGYLTKESIRRAFLDDSPGKLGVATPIRDGEIVRAIVDFDPALHILSATLNHSQFLPVGEVVQAIKLLVQSFDDRPKVDSAVRLLTNGTDASADAMDVDIASELEAASNEIDRALTMLDDGIAVRNNTLPPALVRLHSFPSSVISSTLRSMLSRHDLESLMRILHHEFKNGGWTSPYDFADSGESIPENASEETDDSAVAIIASLLSCTLDAIGPTTWLTPVGDQSSEGLILDLLEDTSTALNGFWEATYIRGLVSELLRYATKLPKSQIPSKETLERQGKPFAVDVKQEELPMLPLGAKADLGTEKTKVGRGGQRKERSAREMGMLISKRVPKYSFERIVI